MFTSAGSGGTSSCDVSESGLFDEFFGALLAGLLFKLPSPPPPWEHPAANISKKINKQIPLTEFVNINTPPFVDNAYIFVYYYYKAPARPRTSLNFV